MRNQSGVESADQQIVWHYRRDLAADSILHELENAMKPFEGRPFTFMTDLRHIRYILPEDRHLINLVHAAIHKHQVLDTVYLVDFRNYHRMRLLIHLNRFPNPDMVFKYEADAHDYLQGIILKQRKQWYEDSNASQMTASL